MRIAVDSSVLFDIIKGAPGAAAAQAALEQALEGGSACICPVVLAELGRYFGRESDLRAFIDDCQLDYDTINLASALEAARIMRLYAKNKGPRERVAADFLIGAHAAKQTDALLSTDGSFYRQYFRPSK